MATTTSKNKRGSMGSVKTSTQVLDEKNKQLQDTLNKSRNGKQSSNKVTPWSRPVQPAVKRTQVVVEAHPKWLLSPMSSARLIWDFSQLLLLAYISIMLPIRIGFELTPSNVVQVFEWVVDFAFVVDVVINFFTSYVNEEGVLVTSHKAIAKHYMRTWFIIDAVSSVPDVVFFGSAAAKTLKVGRILKPFRLIRLSRLLRLFRKRAFLERIEDYLAFNHNILAMLKLPVIVLLFCHLGACAFYFVGNINSDGWVDVFLIREETFATQYNMAFYWVVSSATTVGYGDIVPVTNSERTMAVFIMLLGGGLFGYAVTILGVTVAKINAHGALFTEKMDILKAYAKKRNLPRNLQYRLRSYYKQYFAHRTAFDEKQLLSSLSSSLRHEVALNLLDEAIMRQPLLQGTDPEFLSGLFLCLKPVLACAGDLVMECGEIGNEMFFVVEGEMEVLSPDNEPLYLLRAGSSVGEAELLAESAQQARMVTVRALADTKMSALNRADFEELIRDKPATLAIIRQNAINMYAAWRKLLVSTRREKSMGVSIPEASSPHSDTSTVHTMRSERHHSTQVMEIVSPVNSVTSGMDADMLMSLGERVTAKLKRPPTMQGLRAEILDLKAMLATVVLEQRRPSSSASTVRPSLRPAPLPALSSMESTTTELGKDYEAMLASVYQSKRGPPE